MNSKKKKSKKKSVKKTSPKKIISKEEEKMPFLQWFDKKVKEGILGYWQKAEILNFFKEKNLSDYEDADKYNKLLKEY